MQDVTQNWNDSWVEAGEEDPFYFKALLGVTLGAYAGGHASLAKRARQVRCTSSMPSQGGSTPQQEQPLAGPQADTSTQHNNQAAQLPRNACML